VYNSIVMKILDIYRYTIKEKQTINLLTFLKCKLSNFLYSNGKITVMVAQEAYI